MPTLDPNQDHEISLTEAIEMTTRYRNSTQFNNFYGGFFGKTAIQDILDQEDCAGIRYYYGMNSQNVPVLVLVGVTTDNRDMTEGKLAEMSLPCPDICDSESPLKND